jgi:hypothetical protein
MQPNRLEKIAQITDFSLGALFVNNVFTARIEEIEWWKVIPGESWTRAGRGKPCQTV